MISEILAAIKSLAHKSSMPREMTLPTGAKAVLTLDAAGNEVVHFERKDEWHPEYLFTTIDDMLNFIRSIPERYGDARAADYRELYVYTEQDIPVMFSIADKATNPLMLEQLFTLREDEDFARWFSGEAMDQTQFHNLLFELAHQHDQQDLIGAMKVLTYRVEINYEASIETERNLELAYSEKEMKGSVIVPKVITVTCPVFAGTKFQLQTEFDILVVKPKNPNDKIKFRLQPHGKTITKIKRDAAKFIAEEEFIKPAQEIIAGFATTIPAIYLRANIKRQQYNSMARFDSKSSNLK